MQYLPIEDLFLAQAVNRHFDSITGRAFGLLATTLDHHEALMDCANAKFAALLYKDHFYLGCAHAMILEKLFPDTGELWVRDYIPGTDPPEDAFDVRAPLPADDC